MFVYLVVSGEFMISKLKNSNEIEIQGLADQMMSHAYKNKKKKKQ